MTRRLAASLVAAISILGSGCARWSDAPSQNYVTIEADSRHDTELARKEYKAARKCMDRQLAGKECDFNKAEKHLKQALAADVRFGPAHHSLGVLYFWQRKLYLAAWEFEYASRLMPDRFEPLNNLGLVYESAGKYEQSKTFYNLAREKSPNQPEIIGNLARASFRNGESVDQMRVLLEDVLATDSRPEWRRWAAEKLGLNPVNVATSTLTKTQTLEPPTVPAPADNKKHDAIEDLPLIPPPSPNNPNAPNEFDSAALPSISKLFEVDQSAKK